MKTEPLFTNKERVRMKQRLAKKINMPVWVLIVFISIAVMMLGVLAAQAFEIEKQSAVNTYKEAEYLKTASLADVQELAIKTVWYKAGLMSGLVVISLAVGTAIGLAHGVALVRVSK